MIGCSTYTNNLECFQYVQDIFMMKSLLIIILLIFSFSIIFYSKTKHCKKLKKEFTSIRIMLFLPTMLAYVYLGFSFYFPFLLSVNVGIDAFMNFIYAFVVPTIAWISMLSFLLFIDWVTQRLGFENFKHFIQSVMKR